MKIGVIGAGMIGGTLVRRLTKLGHEVAVANSRGPETLSALAAETGATAVSPAVAARHGEMVIVAIPLKAVTELPKDLLAGVSASVVVIDANNYYRFRDGSIAAIDDQGVESAWVAAQLRRPVIKAFNNLGFMSLLDKGRPKGAADRMALSVAGDPSDARVRVMQLVEELGFDAVDAGGLDESWRQQPGTPAYGKDLDASRLKEALASAERSRIAEYRHAADEAVKAYFQKPT